MPTPPLRIIFMGTPDFAVPSLEALLAHNGAQVVAVVTQPDRPKGRGQKLTPPPVKEIAGAAGTPLLQPQKIRSEEFLNTLAAFAPDLIVVAAYGRILPGPLLRLPPLGTINVHGSLLPKYRGAAPVQWAVLNGETETGVTIMQMNEGLDTGDILLAEKIAIEPQDTAGSLMTRLAALGGQVLVRALDLLRAGKLPRRKQDDRLATLAPPLTKEMGLIDWSKPAAAISCLIRGLDPWPTAHTLIKGSRLRLFAPKLIDSASDCAFMEQQLASRGMTALPGTICHAGQDGFAVTCGRQYLLIREVQPEGGRRMPAGAYLAGHALAIIGQRLGGSPA